MSARIIIVPTGKTGPSGSASSSALDDLTDVTITAAASGDILRYNGSAWVDAVGTTFFEAAGAVATHEADTTNVHGIADTSALETTTGSASKVSTHAALTSSVHGISTFGATLVDDADASAARTTLGLGSIATQASSSVSITGGSITGITDLAVADGGTGASDAATARTNLGVAIGTNVQAYSTRLADLAAISPSQGDVIYYNGTAWVRLAAGTSGQVLQTGGAGANPSWATASGSIYSPVSRSSAGAFIAPAAVSLTTTVTIQASFPNWAPMIVPRSLTIDQIMIEVKDTGTSRTAKFGLWADNGSGAPGTLILDSGSVSTDTTGVKAVSVSTTLSPGLYWVGIYVSANTNIEGVPQGAGIPVTHAQYASVSYVETNASFPAGALASNPTGIYNGNTGANRTPWIRLRMA